MGCDSVVRILVILDKVLDELRRSNPYDLVLKGGTALAIHHLNDHRESEDLDFDVDQRYFGEAEQISVYLAGILDSLVHRGFLQSYTIRKKGFASTNRYHMNLTLETHKQFYSKIDIEFTDLPDDLEYEGELGFYRLERMLVGKLLAFVSRKELKDIYDISYLLKKVEASSFDKPDKLANLVNSVIEILGDSELIRSYRSVLGNIDLRFHSLKERNVHSFIERTVKALRIFMNELKKRS